MAGPMSLGSTADLLLPLMRVIYDHQVFSLQNAGGASRYHCELIRYLSRRSDVAINALLGLTGRIFAIGSLKSDSVRLRSFGTRLGPGLFRYAVNEAFTGMTAPTLGTQDLYHSTLYRFLPLVRAKSRIVTHHDCVHEKFPQLFTDGDRVVRSKRKLFAAADAIICVSESSRRDLEEFYGVDRARTRVIHHGLNPLPRSASAAQELLRKVRRDYLLFVGSRATYKNFELLLKAFRDSGLNRSYDLLTIGGGILKRKELETLASLGLDKSVISIPTASDSLLAEAYARSTLFVYPSLYEGFGFPPLEAMAAGCPVLVGNTSSLPEICGDAPFYFDPESAESLRESLLRAVSDTERRSAAIKRGQEVAGRYSWDRCGETTLDLYRQCI